MIALNLILGAGVVFLAAIFFLKESGETSASVSYNFFVETENRGIEIHMAKENDIVVHNGERFGVMAYFKSTDSTVKLQLRLVTPGSPENFLCPECKSGELTLAPDGRTVIVNKSYRSSDRQDGFQWGIDSKDPRGSYQLQASFNDMPLKTYSFEVK